MTTCDTALALEKATETLERRHVMFASGDLGAKGPEVMGATLNEFLVTVKARVAFLRNQVTDVTKNWRELSQLTQTWRISMRNTLEDLQALSQAEARS